MLIESTKNGIETVLEITPKFFSTWDLQKLRRTEDASIGIGVVITDHRLLIEFSK
jgi:hypothetical protein